MAASFSALFCVTVVLSLVITVCNGGFIKYNTGAGVVDGKLNVHLVPHTHDDVGWLKTVDQYYVGSNNSIQGACVENVLDSLVVSLRRDPNRKFIYVEMAFFNRWWETQDSEIRNQVKELVDSGQLEFVNGGWCMHDEAATHYIDMIDQTTLGHGLIKSQFNKTPRAGWQIDPFGHSAVQAYLLGSDLGFDSIHFARIDYQDRAVRLNNKTLEVVWRGSRTFGGSNQIFTNVFPRHYSPPDGFEFEADDDYVPVQDNPVLFDYNVARRVEDFVTAALQQANVTRSNHIMWTMGDDFMYQYAESWFKQMDKLIHYVNKDGRVNALYSTPTIYTDAKHSDNLSWPLKSDDYFPYADRSTAYWTGYFTSRPAFKRYVRMLSGYYLAARQLEFLTERNSSGPNTYSLGDALGIAQHHDAVSGTAKQHTTNDYAKRLAIGASEAETVVNSALSSLATPGLPLSQCQLLNISFCPPAEDDISEGKSLVVVVYNPLGWNRTEIIKIPVNDPNVVVKDSTGKELLAQHVELDSESASLRSVYVKAYTGISPPKPPKFWLFFQVSVSPLSWNTYSISKTVKTENARKESVAEDFSEKKTITVGPGNLKLQFSKTSGQLVRMFNSRTGVDIHVQQSYLWYTSSVGQMDGQASGAYIFRPNDSPPTIVSRSVAMNVTRGPLLHEVHQTFDSWIHQVVRVYKDKEHAEFEYTIGPIPSNDGVGKEVITRFTTNMATNKVFFTDSNGRDFLKRVRDHRDDWPLQVTQPVAGNYYPINLGIFTSDKQSEFSVLVDRAAGGSSIKDGQVEIMLHRRMFHDDGRGVGEPLDETVCLVNGMSFCEGLKVRGNYYVSINQLGDGARWRRTTGQEIYSPLVVAFTHENGGDQLASLPTKTTVMDPNYSLPPNVALITLQVLNDGSVLLRLAHLYEAGEDAEYSTLAKVELKKMFSDKAIESVEEMSLSANQLISELKTKDWKVEEDGSGKVEFTPIRGGPLSSSALIVELGPMEIRTFVLKF